MCVGEKIGRERSKKRCLDVIESDVKRVGVSVEDAEDRAERKLSVADSKLSGEKKKKNLIMKIINRTRD